jgi:hypothetical protein
MPTPSDNNRQTHDNAIERSPTFTARPLTTTMPTRSRSAGRPPKLEMPELPALRMSEIEQGLFDYFIAAYTQEYPDLIPSDHLILFLAAIEFIKYIRMAAEELESGKLVTMSRQHPGTQLRGLMDQLSVTRKARVAGKRDTTNAEEREMREFFMGMSKKP